MTFVTTGATYIYIEECEIALGVKVESVGFGKRRKMRSE